MSYPFRPNPTYEELFGVLKKFQVSLCGYPGLSFENPQTGEHFQPQYLHRKGYSVLGVVMRGKAQSVTWSKVEYTCMHFDIPATEFGLDAGWPPPGEGLEGV